jgi:hypothetical protein
MKPDGWDKLTSGQKMELAQGLLRSMRGSYIIGQALAQAVAAMRQVKNPEYSNIGDMEMLGECLFSLGYGLTNAMLGKVKG